MQENMERDILQERVVTGQGGMDSGQPALLKGVTAHGRGFGTG